MSQSAIEKHAALPVQKQDQMERERIIALIVDDLKRNGPIAHAVETYVLPRVLEKGAAFRDAETAIKNPPRAGA